jgi:hypothetical protein
MRRTSCLTEVRIAGKVETEEAEKVAEKDTKAVRTYWIV